MKKLFLLIVTSVLTMVGYCSIEAENNPVSNIEQRVKSIYQLVGKESEADINKRFCTQNNIDLNKRCEVLSRKTDDLFRDYDHWIMGQDYDEGFYVMIDSIEILGDRAALAHVLIHNFEDQHITLQLIFERGDWFVNDIIRYEKDNDGKETEISEIEIMVDYLDSTRLDWRDLRPEETTRLAQIEKVVKQLEKRYGMKITREAIQTVIAERYLWGLVQFGDEYRGVKRDKNDDRHYALALDVLIDGKKVYVHEVLGNWYGEGDMSWNVDDEGKYVGCDILDAYEGDEGLIINFCRLAAESRTKGKFYQRRGRLDYEEWD